MAHLVMHTLQSDPGEPKNLEEAFNGPDKAKWYSSVKEEVQNFVDRDAWEEVPLHKVVEEGNLLGPRRFLKSRKSKMVRQDTRVE
jgi:hypothetical protein